jgi:anthranilate phosphoribosyltransferase
VLEAAGVRLDVSPPMMAALHNEIGIAFLFAPMLHPAMKAVMPVRRALGVRTVFNLLGPLTNPACVTRQVIGVWGPDVQDLVASALAELGARRALVVHSEDGLDEISVNAPTRIIEIRDGVVVDDWKLEPRDLGIVVDDPASLSGGDVEENLRRMREILAGHEVSAAAEAVAVNAAAALYVADMAETMARGLEAARETLQSGAGLVILESLGKRSMEISEGV